MLEKHLKILKHLIVKPLMGALLQIGSKICHVGRQESNQASDNSYRKSGLSELPCGTREYSTAMITALSVPNLVSNILLSVCLPTSATRKRRILQEQ